MIVWNWLLKAATNFAGCMVLDVFHAWPREALENVAQRFLEALQPTNIQSDSTLVAIGSHMAEAHLSIDWANRKFLQQERPCALILSRGLRSTPPPRGSHSTFLASWTYGHLFFSLQDKSRFKIARHLSKTHHLNFRCRVHPPKPIFQGMLASWVCFW